MSAPVSLFCSGCGQQAMGVVWPWVCSGCNTTHFCNPKPVAVALVPVEENGGVVGFVGVRRNIAPALGGLAFPGGFLELGEDATMGAVRELLEETGLALSDDEWTTVGTRITPKGDVLLIGMMGPSVPLASVQGLVLTDAQRQETQEVVVVGLDDALAFPLHEQLREAALGLAQAPARSALFRTGM